MLYLFSELIHEVVCIWAPNPMKAAGFEGGAAGSPLKDVETRSAKASSLATGEQQHA